MSHETESKLGELFAQLPDPDSEVSERALARALTALPTRARAPERPTRALAILLAAAIALLALAAGALAAAGALHVSFGPTTKPKPSRAAPAAELTVPRGADGIAATIDGRLWLTTASGLRLQGLPVTAAALSPHSLYVAVGIGHSLVAMAPDGRRAWSIPTAGPVEAIAWAPDGLRIAYLIKTNRTLRLYTIEGNGTNNQLLDPTVRATPPSWRADSLAVAYIAAGGHPVIYDFGHNAHVVLHTPTAQNPAFLAFNPTRGRQLALATAHTIVVTGPAGTTSTTFGKAAIAGIGWTNGTLAIAVNPSHPAAASSVRLLRVPAHGNPIQIRRLTTPNRIEALDTTGSRLTLALATQAGTRVLSTKSTATNATLTRTQLLLRLPNTTRISSLTVR